MRAISPAWILLFPWLAAAAGPVDYVRDVKPIFAKHCVSCHGPDKQRSSLRLDAATFVHKGGNSGKAIVPGKSGDSLLLKAVSGADKDLVMPPKGERLSAAEVATLRAWIDAGAKAPANETVAQASAGRNHWAFQPIKRQPEPGVKLAGWARNPIDRFVLARLEKNGVRPSAEADKVTLLRRVYLDLIGLPPSPREMDEFLNDKQHGAYERLVDRLLDNPHYGERWGRHWLDQARYADSNGYSIDAPRAMWKYRDWVIDAMNHDMRFDQFTIEQLAGDLLPKATLAQRVATGFHRNTQINQEGGIDLEQFRVESIVDRVNTTGSVWLGLTIGCCQCHDHKFDPIAQREYYQFFAFLNTVDEPVIDVAPAEEIRRRDQALAGVKQREARLKTVDRTTPERIMDWEGKIDATMRASLPKDLQHILTIAVAGRSPAQVATIEAAYRRFDKMRHTIGGVGNPLPFLAAAHVSTFLDRNRLEKELAELKPHLPNIPTAMVVQERKQPRTTNIMLGGDFTRKGAVVGPGTPAVLHTLNSADATKQNPRGNTPGSPKSPNRLDLARWLVEPANPLTARVIVNRFWQVYFGTGIVETDNDFGTQGTPPSHPELLDWLASEFVARGWSMKAMHRLIVTSATYRQASHARSDLATLDPRNRLLARQNRLRLEAEVVRDVALATSGLLVPKIGGPSVYPPQPKGVYAFTQIPRVWTASKGADRYRRGMYTFFWRSAPHPGLVVFDAPDATSTCTRRNRSNTPLQALTLLNDQAYLEFAQALAGRVLKESSQSDAGRIDHAFRLCLGRSARPNEANVITRLLSRERESFRASPEDAKTIAPTALPSGVDVAQGAAWTTAARALLNLDEFITRE